MVKPIRPEDVVEVKVTRTLPPFVIETFNDFIAKNYSGGYATIYTKDIVPVLMERGNCERRHVFSERWLDVEEIYRDNGWKVKYDSPGYNESYPAYFEFRKK